MIQKNLLDRIIVSIIKFPRILKFYDFLRKKTASPHAIILLYHRIAPEATTWPFETIRPENFEVQIKYLRQTYKILPLEKLAQYIYEKNPIPKNSVAITFDDGYKDNYLYAYPVLKKYGVPAIIFLTAQQIGTDAPFWWDKVGYIIQNTSLETIDLEKVGSYSLQSKADKNSAFIRICEILKRMPAVERDNLIKDLCVTAGFNDFNDLGQKLILSWDEIIEMSTDNITFGAHTMTHPLLANLSIDQAKYEISQSKKIIEDRLGKEITLFSYPYGFSGSYNDEHIELLQECGFVCAVTALPGLINSRARPYELRRISPNQDFDLFKSMVCGLYSDLDALSSKILRIFRAVE